MGWSGALQLRIIGQHCEDTAQGLLYKRDIYGAISLREAFNYNSKIQLGHMSMHNQIK